jgi:hypothetical protein
MPTPFPYAARARDVEEARSALHAASRGVKGRANPKDPTTAKWRASVERFNAALGKAYPEHFWSDINDLRAGNACQIEIALSFLEADPLFFRRIVLHRIANRGGREFRHYCHFARCLDGAGFRTSVASLADSADPAIARRAKWVLSAIDQSRDD